MTATATTCECGGPSEVTETRHTGRGAVRRRRHCKTCSAKWTTAELRVDDHNYHGVRVAFLPRRRLTAEEALALVASLVAVSEAED